MFEPEAWAPIFSAHARALAGQVQERERIITGLHTMPNNTGVKALADVDRNFALPLRQLRTGIVDLERNMFRAGTLLSRFLRVFRRGVQNADPSEAKEFAAAFPKNTTPQAVFLRLYSKSLSELVQDLKGPLRRTERLLRRQTRQTTAAAMLRLEEDLATTLTTFSHLLGKYANDMTDLVRGEEPDCSDAAYVRQGTPMTGLSVIVFLCAFFAVYLRTVIRYSKQRLTSTPAEQARTAALVARMKERSGYEVWLHAVNRTDLNAEDITSAIGTLRFATGLQHADPSEVGASIYARWVQDLAEPHLNTRWTVHNYYQLVAGPVIITTRGPPAPPTRWDRLLRRTPAPGPPQRRLVNLRDVVPHGRDAAAWFLALQLPLHPLAGTEANQWRNTHEARAGPPPVLTIITDPAMAVEILEYLETYPREFVTLVTRLLQDSPKLTKYLVSTFYPAPPTLMVTALCVDDWQTLTYHAQTGEYHA